MRLSNRTLNRTLWVRQQLVPELRDPALADPIGLAGHLLGLQAQETLAPYLSLAARLPDFDPAELSEAIGTRQLVRLLVMRGTVHLLTPDDARTLRPWVQPSLDRLSRGNQMSRPARDVASADLLDATQRALADGPRPVAELGAALAARFPGVPEPALRNAARERVAMAQVPPRGMWGRSGGVVYELVTSWVGAPLADPDPAELVRRYLRAFGPASAADMTAWSSVTRLGPVFTSLGDELVQYETETGKLVHDLADGTLADADTELPPVLLGNYDNLWLSHADRTRIASDESRKAWMGANGGVGAGVFVDGMLEGHWRRDGHDLVVTPYRKYTKAEQRGVDAELERVRALLAR